MSYYFVENPGYLELQGGDVIDFLQRQTTNDVHKFDRKSALVTILTSPKARIIDVLTLLPDLNEKNDRKKPDIGIHILTLPGYGTSTAEFLTNRIFFMDKVSITEKSGEYVQIELFGDAAAAAITKIGFSAPPNPAEILSNKMDGSLVRVVGRIKEFQPGCRLILPAKNKETVLKLLEDTGSTPLKEEQYNVLRMEAGLPRAGYELTSDYTPLEVGLKEMVSETKGCYTGQEVIARQINFDKVTKRLSGLKLLKGAQIADRIWFENKSVGVITSVGYSARYGDIALAIVKRPHYQPGAELNVGENSANTVKSVVTGLPFSD